VRLQHSIRRRQPKVTIARVDRTFLFDTTLQLKTNRGKLLSIGRNYTNAFISNKAHQYKVPERGTITHSELIN
jgi:hypothetical protein